MALTPAPAHAIEKEKDVHRVRGTSVCKEGKKLGVTVRENKTSDGQGENRTRKPEKLLTDKVGT